VNFLKFSRSCCILRGFAIGCLLVVGLLQTPGYSAPFNLSENGSGLDTLPPTFGELPHSIDGLTTPWPVDIGIATFPNNVFVGGFGCFGFGCGNVLTNRVDVFRIEIPSGIQVTNILIENPSTGAHTFEFGENGDIGGIFNQFISSTPFNFTSVLSAGIYDARITKGVSGGYRWVFTAEAAPIPEPSTMLLWGPGLVGLIGYASRRRKQVI